MKKIALIIILFCSLLSTSQPLQQYLFNNSLNGTNGGGTLTEVFSCGATNGSFSSQNITTEHGFCSNATAFCFNEGGGLSYPNVSISNQYTINLFFKFNTFNGWSRIIDFSNGLTDAGVYFMTDCLNFYPNGTVGPCPNFSPNMYYLFTLVRNASTNIVSVYINGTLLASYNDTTNLYAPATTSTPIIFFRDDNVIPCEDKPGCVKYLSISPSTLTAFQIDSIWQNICLTVNPCKADAGSIKVLCESQSTNLGGSPSASGGSGSFTYSWSPSSSLNNNSLPNPIASPDAPSTTYTLTINDGAGCIKQDTVSVIINPTPTLQLTSHQTINSNSSLTLTASGALNYTWFPTVTFIATNGSKVLAQPDITTTYTVIGANSFGCSNKGYINIIVEAPCGGPYVPNAFTPNGDSNNDTWCIYGDCLVNSNVLIFNRWGEKIFESSETLPCWNGYYKGKLQSPDVFIYKLSAKLIDGTTIYKQGTVTLIK
ncbi:MAG: gliding motility-associated C-terminal domain-containing protein [Bacteroidia bacterium]|nr:gliding motility-associated C-terminal domain-containing protein [Bacteroidia bacterium]